MNKKETQNFFLLLALFNYFFLIFLGFAHILSMVQMKMPMEHCPYAMLSHSICKISIVDHSKSWLGFFKGKHTFWLFIFGVLTTTTLFLVINHNITRYLLYIRQKRSDYSHFIFLFSNGILNPKIY